MLLKGSFHDLSLSANSPDSDFTFHTSSDKALAVVSWADGSDSVVVCVVDGVEQLSRLGQESSDFSVVPAGDDALSVAHKENAVALEAWYFNSKQFLASLCVPHADVGHRAGSEQFGVTARELNVVNSFVVARVSQFWVDSISVAPVDGSLCCACKEVG